MNGPNDADSSEMAEHKPQNKQNVFKGFMRGLISRSSYQKCSDMKRGRNLRSQQAGKWKGGRTGDIDD